MSRLQRWFAGGLVDDEASDLQVECAQAGLPTIATCQPGEQVHVIGTVRSMTLRPGTQAPRFEIQVYDGTGVMNVVWLGRRSLAGVEPGTRIVIHGRLTCTNDRPIVFNPRYELKPVAV